MEKTIEINYGNAITVNRGNYENEKPMWHQKITFKLNGETPEEIALIEETEFLRLKTAIDKRAEEAWAKAKQDLGNIRIRIKDGKKYPSYSSINHPDPLPIDPEFATRGTNVHTVVNEWIKTGKWTKPEPLKKLKYDDIPYQKFFELFKDRIDLKDSKLNVEVFHDRLLYSGEIDCIALVDNLPTLIDFKTGSWDWMQLIAYYKAYNTVKQLAIFDLKKLELEILKLTDPKCQEKWEAFLIKRGVFQARFGL